jgi:hypothetical protein
MRTQHVRRMKSYVAANPQGKLGRAEYRLADYGLDCDWVRERYAEYYDAYLPGTPHLRRESLFDNL